MRQTTAKQFIEAEAGLNQYIDSDQYIMIAQYAKACHYAKVQLEADAYLSMIRRCHAEGSVPI